MSGKEMNRHGKADTPGFETRAIHAGQAPDPTTGAVITPVYLTSTYVHDSPGEHRGFEYSRSQNPTRKAYETCVASLEGARFGFAFASGCIGAATWTLPPLPTSLTRQACR